MTAAARKRSTKTLTEIERQEAYLAALPEKFDFPLFSGKQAVESQRKSAYKTTAHAAREIVDNALEAGASNFWVALKRPGQERKKHARQDAVAAVAFIDDGPGMRPKMARFALSWGGGTHTKDPDFIARFGFGLPNSSINQTRRVEVYSKTADAEHWVRAVLDINDVPEFGMASIPEPQPAELPDFVDEFLERKDIDLKSGTVVVWDRPDRLTYAQGTRLKEHLRHDFGVVYRYLLDKFSIFLEDDRVKKVDPLFLSPDGLFYVAPEQGGAERTFYKQVSVKYWRDERTGTPHLERLETTADLASARKQAGVQVGTIEVQVARFPYEFVLGDKKHKGTDGAKRFAIRKGRRGMSFVRARREIETVDAFPTSSSDEASGLGSWPVLQSYAYHWGIEVRFGPELDDAFGVGNDKQTVRPIEAFWRVMHEVEVDRAARQEEEHQRAQRSREKARRTEAEVTSPDHPNPATEAAAQAEEVLGRYSMPEERKREAQEIVEATVGQRAQETGEPYDAVREAIEEEAARKRYVIRFFESEGGVFFRPELGNGLQRVAAVNKLHPFFQLFYSRLIDLGDPRARQAVDLLLLALAQAELKTEGTKQVVYEHEREQEWSPFLAASLRILAEMERDDDEPQGE